jgi:small subunit ribosomal protein S4
VARYTGSVCKLCRREGVKLFLKGDKCYAKCILEKRKTIPGQHGKEFRNRKLSEYNKRLREKQKLKRLIGLTERPFRRYFAEASRLKGLTGENLLRLLETRLDNVTQRLGFAISKVTARQMVLHGHIRVNGKLVNIPSYQLKPGDKVSLIEKSRENVLFKKWWEQTGQSLMMPSWLEKEQGSYSGTMKSWPMREEISFPVNEQLIVELYSK